MRIFASPSALESFSDIPSNNRSELESIKSLSEHREACKQISYFDKPEDNIGYNWIAFPYSDSEYFLVVYILDPDSFAVREVFSGKWPLTPGSSAGLDVIDFLSAAQLYPSELAIAQFSFPDSFLHYAYSSAKDAALKSYPATAVDSPTSAIPVLANDPVVVKRHIEKVGGKAQIGNNVGIPLLIDYDYNAGKLRARTNDGVNGPAYVAFPNAARAENAIYLLPVNAITWNGKNYRVSNSYPVFSYRII